MSTENCIICKPCDPRSPSPLQLFTMVCTVPQPSLLAVAVLPSALCRVAGLLLYECFLFLLRLRRDPEVSAQLPLLFLTLSWLAALAAASQLPSCPAGDSAKLYVFSAPRPGCPLGIKTITTFSPTWQRPTFSQHPGLITGCQHCFPFLLFCPFIQVLGLPNLPISTFLALSFSSILPPPYMTLCYPWLQLSQKSPNFPVLQPHSFPASSTDDSQILLWPWPFPTQKLSMDPPLPKLMKANNQRPT